MIGTTGKINRVPIALERERALLEQGWEPGRGADTLVALRLFRENTILMIYRFEWRYARGSSIGSLSELAQLSRIERTMDTRKKRNSQREKGRNILRKVREI